MEGTVLGRLSRRRCCLMDSSNRRSLAWGHAQVAWQDIQYHAFCLPTPSHSPLRAIRDMYPPAACCWGGAHVKALPSLSGASEPPATATGLLDDCGG